MKRMLFVLVLVVLAAGAGFAQEGRSRMRRPDWGRGGQAERKAPEKVTMSGNLGLRRGMITIETEGQIYYTAGLERFTGFIDGLKAGAAVNAEGFAPPVREGQEARFLWVTKLTLGGKDYELSPFTEQGFNSREGWGMPGFRPGQQMMPRRHREFNNRNRRGGDRRAYGCM